MCMLYSYTSIFNLEIKKLNIKILDQIHTLTVHNSINIVVHSEDERRVPEIKQQIYAVIRRAVYRLNNHFCVTFKNLSYTSL